MVAQRARLTCGFCMVGSFQQTLLSIASTTVLVSLATVDTMWILSRILSRIVEVQMEGTTRLPVETAKAVAELDTKSVTCGTGKSQAIGSALNQLCRPSR